MKKFILIFMFLPFLLPAQTSYEKGVELVNWQKFAEAVPFLENALISEPKNVDIYLHLAIVYENTGEFVKWASILQRALQLDTPDKCKVYYMLGNLSTKRNEYSIAEQMYTNAIAQNTSFSGSYLNRAKCRLNLKKYQEAIGDYEQFLSLEPFTSKRPEIEKMIAALRNYLKAEADRLLAEKEREANLINEVLDSLNNATDENKDIRVKSDKVLTEPEPEMDIED